MALRFERRARKIWLFAHLGTSAAWLGVSMGMTALSVVGAVGEPVLASAAYQIMHVFDLALVIPTVLSSIVSGCVLSLGTQWGLTQHWWIVAKLAMATSILVTAAVWENFLVRGLASRAQELHGTEPIQLAACMAVFLVLLWAATWLSVFKPRGRTPWSTMPRSQ
ncbi:MAG: hypothetical protein KC933_19850 [Myxococcales bacterium]|nr:hypothetical protein [Myxococcales bacterium]MCB9650221.1 hypothetical protein [Deltaproteobacteria bacterium]